MGQRHIYIHDHRVKDASGAQTIHKGYTITELANGKFTIHKDKTVIQHETPTLASAKAIIEQLV